MTSTGRVELLKQLKREIEKTLAFSEPAKREISKLQEKLAKITTENGKLAEELKECQEDAKKYGDAWVIEKGERKKDRVAFEKKLKDCQGEAEFRYKEFNKRYGLLREENTKLEKKLADQQPTYNWGLLWRSFLRLLVEKVSRFKSNYKTALESILRDRFGVKSKKNG